MTLTSTIRYLQGERPGMSAGILPDSTERALANILSAAREALQRQASFRAVRRAMSAIPSSSALQLMAYEQEKRQLFDPTLFVVFLKIMVE